MNRIICLLMCFLLALSVCIPIVADGDPNIDGGGGETGGGDIEGGSYWNVGDDGVRVTVVKETSRSAVTTPLDFTNAPLPVEIMHFGRKNKLQYSSSNDLLPQVGSTYNRVQPAAQLPMVVSAGGGSNIDAVKQYFCMEGTIKDIAQKTGFDYKKLISGDYVLLLEPILYFRYEGIKIAATATEVALYDQIVSGGVRSKLGYATHQNLPLAMFLELPQLGYPAYAGSTSGVIDDATIISQLGLGIVNFKDQICCDHAPDCPCLKGKPNGPDCECKKDHHDDPCDPSLPSCKCKPMISTWDYEYRTDTDVITAVRIHSGGEINPDHDASVIFTVLGKTYTKSYVIPAGESQLLWFKWHTPKVKKIAQTRMKCEFTLAFKA